MRKNKMEFLCQQASYFFMKKKKLSSKKDFAESYERKKEFEGKQYTGMPVGRTHHWHYDMADWKEKKITPDKWEFAYSTVKRRTGHAPEGSGVPVGTGYHWFILAHQFVDKLDANDYNTAMTGLKFKLAHRRADKGKWNSSANAQARRLIEYLEEVIAHLKKHPEQVTPIELDFDYKGEHYTGTGVPVLTSCGDGICNEIDLTLNGKHTGIIRNINGKWKISELKSQALANAIGEQITLAYQK